MIANACFPPEPGIDAQVKKRTQSEGEETSEACEGEGDRVTETCVQDPAQAIIPRGTAESERGVSTAVKSVRF